MCKSLEMINQDGEIRVSSRVVAKDFGKDHSNVIKTIKNILGGIVKIDDTQDGILMFNFSTYTNEQNKQVYPEYFMNRDGFSLLVMGFTGKEALQWKLKYINAFNKMEQKIKSPYQNLSKELQAIFVLDEKHQKLEKEVKDLKNNMPLFNIECDELQAQVRKIGIRCLGGKDTKAYKNRSLRAKVYCDIQRELKRQFGVQKYKAIKRSQFEIAKEILRNYKLPLLLKDSIIVLNNQVKMEIK